MANFWFKEGKNAVSGEKSLSFGELVKPFGRKYKGMWRIFGVSENGEILLISDENIGEVTLAGVEGYNRGIDQLDQFCIDTIQSSKAAAVRSITSLDLMRVREYDEKLNLYINKPDCWLATSYVSSAGFCGMKALGNGRITSITLRIYDGAECNVTLGVRAVVTLRKNVEFHKTKDGYLKI